MRVLFDQATPVPIRQFLIGHGVRKADPQGTLPIVGRNRFIAPNRHRLAGRINKGSHLKRRNKAVAPYVLLCVLLSESDANSRLNRFMAQGSPI